MLAVFSSTPEFTPTPSYRPRQHELWRLPVCRQCDHDVRHDQTRGEPFTPLCSRPSTLQFPRRTRAQQPAYVQGLLVASRPAAHGRTVGPGCASSIGTCRTSLSLTGSLSPSARLSQEHRQLQACFLFLSACLFGRGPLYSFPGRALQFIAIHSTAHLLAIGKPPH